MPPEADQEEAEARRGTCCCREYRGAVVAAVGSSTILDHQRLRPRGQAWIHQALPPARERQSLIREVQQQAVSHPVGVEAAVEAAAEVADLQMIL